MKETDKDDEIIIISTPGKKPIKGISVINNKIRCQLNLSMEQYAVLDEILTASKNNKIEIKKVEDIAWIKCGISSTALHSIIQDLQMHKLIVVNSTETHYIITEQFTKYFEYTEDFEELWIAYERMGNKSEAKICYNRCRKIATKEEILNGAVHYLKYKKQLQTPRQYIMNLQTLLNPDKRKWEDKYDIKAETNTYQFVKRT